MTQYTKKAPIWSVKTSSLTKEVIQSESMEDTGRPNHSAHCSRERGAVYPDSNERRPDVNSLQEPIILNQQGPKETETNY